MIHFEYNGRWYDVNAIEFSGGELHVGMQDRTGLWLAEKPQTVRIATRIQNSAAFMELVFLTELLRRECPPGSTFELCLPYMPYARQDRETDPCTSFTLKAFAKLLNSLAFSNVVFFDPHSDVTPALIENCTVFDQATIITTFFRGLDEFIKKTSPVIVAPDAGAAKKAGKVAKAYGLPLITAEKVRDVHTGNITETIFHNRSVNFAENRAPHFLIVDDICDGGRTFIELAKVMRAQYELCHITLYVTHGIFSQGFAPFKGLIDRIFCTDTFVPKILPMPDEIPLFIGKVTPQPLWRKI